MNLIIFFVAIITYMAICYLGARLYFSFVVNTHQKTWSKLTKGSVLAILFLGFIIIEIPFSIFFPAWVSAKLGIMVDEQGREFTSAFIGFGCFVLLSTLWMAWRSKEGRQFAKVTGG